MAFSNEFVYGYHGCSRDVAEMLLSGKGVSLNSSENDYDWLGSGCGLKSECANGRRTWNRGNPAAIVELKRGDFI